MADLAEVALPLPLRRTFTYEIPQSLGDDVVLGSSVVVPFGSRMLTGYVVEVAHGGGKDIPGRLKAISDVLDPGPLFTPEILEVTRWMADYYMCGWGEALRTAVPEGARVTSRLVAALEDRAAAERALERGGLGEGESRLLRALMEKGSTDAVQLGKRARVLAPHHALRRLEKRGVVALRREFRRRGYAARDDTMPPLEELGTGGMPPSLELAPQQRVVLDPLLKALDEGCFQTALLHGVTSSGKTAVYEVLVAEALERGRGALVLVPEIAITPQMVGIFRARFGERVALFHSRLKPRDRHEQWRRVLEGEASVVIGPRSAVLAPLKHPGVIVVDEEHEPSYKQSEPAPRYHARDVAVYRARRAGAVCVLGSATPSAESYWNALEGKYLLLEMPERIRSRPMPAVRLVDLAEEPKPWKRTGSGGSRREGAAVPSPDVGAGVILSTELEAALARRLERGEQSILFLNRRGFSPALTCNDCGHAEECPDCSVTLTYHKREGQLRCHYCGIVRRPADSCSRCGSARLRYQGIGTQRVEAALNVRFPDAKVLRMDSDTTRERGAHRRIYEAFAGGDGDVLLGTQMVAKGFHFPRVTLVGVISADAELHLPDFRANERTFQLLTQVAGRAGRGDEAGEVIIQSFAVDNPGVARAADGDYAGFMEQELASRKVLGYPPFKRLARVLLKGKIEEELLREAERTAARLRAVAPRSVEILGPAPAPRYRVSRWFRVHVILRGPTAATLRNCIEGADVLERGGRGLAVTVDIDPAELL